jgi:hypothetical protein
MYVYKTKSGMHDPRGYVLAARGVRVSCCTSSHVSRYVFCNVLFSVQVQNVVEMPDNDGLTLLEASRWGLREVGMGGGA